MSSTYNNIYDTNEQNKAVNKNGETTSFIYGDLNQRVQVVNAKSINSTTAYVSVNENNAVRVDVRRVPNKFTVYDENDGQVVYFDGSTAIQINLPEVITNIEYKVSPANNSPIMGFKKGEHYIDFTFGIGTHSQHTYVSLIAIQNLIDSVNQRVDDEIARATEAEQSLNSKIESKSEELLNAITAETAERQSADSALQSEIDTINGKIPNQASAQNQLADKDFVNSSIQNMAAFYVTYDAQGNSFPTKQALIDSTQVYIDGEVREKIGHNDYCIVVADESKHEAAGDPTTRYIYQGDLEEEYDASKWAFQYVINNSGLTAEQLAALNSGITAGLVNEFIAKPDRNSFKTINGESILKKDGEPDNIEIEGVTDYNQLENTPIINVDLASPTFEPIENTYYRHTGTEIPAVTRTFKEGQSISELRFDVNKSISDMNTIFDEFVSTATPIAQESGTKMFAFFISEYANNSSYLPYLFATDKNYASKVVGHETDHDVYMLVISERGDVNNSAAFVNTYVKRQINIDSATWNNSSLGAQSGVYTFNYNTETSHWQYNNENVDLSNYGISGITAGCDSITVNYIIDEKLEVVCVPENKEAGWWNESMTFPSGSVIKTILNDEISLFAGIPSGDMLTPGRIYVYKNNEFILGDYNEQINKPIINADLFADDFTPVDGEYYRQSGDTIKQVKSFESGKYYNKCYLSHPKANTVLQGFEYLDSNVDPDYITMTYNNKDIIVNYPYVDDYERLGAQIKLGDDNKPIKQWVFSYLTTELSNPNRDILHWKEIAVNEWSEFDTYNIDDVVTAKVDIPAIGLEALTVGQTLSNGDKIHFDTSKEDELNNYIASLDESSKTLFSTNSVNSNRVRISLGSFGSVNLVILEYYNSNVPIYASAAATLGGMTFEKGFQNLDEDDNLVLSLTDSVSITTLNDTDPAAWNGVFLGTPTETTVSVDKNFISLQDDNLNHNPATSTDYWQEVNIIEWDARRSYQAKSVIMFVSSTYYMSLSDVVYTESTLPVVLYDNLIASIFATMSNGEMALLYTILIPLWANKEIKFGNKTIPAFTWIDQEGSILEGVPFITLTSWEQSHIDSKLFFRHESVWNSWFSPEPFEKIEYNTLVRREDDDFKKILTESFKELPDITENGKVLKSSCKDYTLKFVNNTSTNRYEYLTSDSKLKPVLAFNTSLSDGDLRECLTRLHQDIDGDLWHLTFECGELQNDDISDIYFVRDTSHKDADNYDAFLIACRTARHSALSVAYSNYAQSYIIDEETVNVDSTGWSLLQNAVEYSNRGILTISYTSPKKVVDISTYGRIISTDVNTDYETSYTLFYGDTADAKAVWADVDGIPDYSKANDNDTLKVVVTPAVVAFPDVEVDQYINGLYILRDSLPSDFSDYDTNDTYYGVYPAVNAIETLVEGTVNGVQTIKYVSLRFLSAAEGGQLVSLIYTASRNDLSSTDVAIHGQVYMTYGGESRWGSAITEDGDFNEVLRKTIENTLGFTNYTIKVVSTFEQSKWRTWMGATKSITEIEPEKKDIEWGSVFPEITKSNQVLTTSVETYSFDFTRNSSNDFRCSVSSTGKLYFNTDLEDEEVQSIVSSFLTMYSSSSTFKQWMFFAKDSSNARLFPYWGFVSGDNDAYAIVAIDPQNAIYQIWANIDGDFTISGQPVGLSCHVGWDLTNIEAYTSWTNASYLQYTSPNDAIPSSAYGKLISLQDGLFYGQTKNAKMSWQDKTSKLSDIEADWETLPWYSSGLVDILGRYSNDDKIARFNNTAVKTWLNVGPTNGNFTVSSSSWNTSNDEFYTTVTINGLTDDYGLMIAPSSRSYAKLAQEANIYYAYSSGTTLYMYCTTKPESSIGFNYTIIK